MLSKFALKLHHKYKFFKRHFQRLYIKKKKKIDISKLVSTFFYSHGKFRTYLKKKKMIKNSLVFHFSLNNKHFDGKI